MYTMSSSAAAVLLSAALVVPGVPAAALADAVSVYPDGQTVPTAENPTEEPSGDVNDTQAGAQAGEPTGTPEGDDPTEAEGEPADDAGESDTPTAPDADESDAPAGSHNPDDDADNTEEPGDPADAERPPDEQPPASAEAAPGQSEQPTGNEQPPTPAADNKEVSIAVENPFAQIVSEPAAAAPASVASVNAQLSEDGTSITLKAQGGLFDTAWNASFQITSSKGTVWAQAKKHSDGSWKATVSAGTTGTGTVTATGWASVGSSPSQSIASTSVIVPVAGANFSLSYSSASGKIILAAHNATCPTGVLFVSAGVTSPAGSTSWYRLTQQADGTWEAQIDPDDFGWGSGTYTVTGSICDNAWAGVSLGKTDLSLSYGTEKATAVVSPNGETVTLTAAGGRFAQAWGVSFEVLGSQGSTWVPAQKQSDGSWKATIPASRVGTGSLSAKAWANISKSSAQSVSSAQASVPAARASIQLSYDSATRKLVINASSVTCPSGVTFVSVGLSCPGSTQRWYRLSKTVDDTWSVSVDPADFSWYSGTYTVVGSICDAAWNGVGTGSSTAQVTLGTTTTSASVDAPKGQATVTVRGDLVEGARNVAFVVSGTDAQGNAKTTWHQGIRQADGSWTATLAASSVGSSTCTAQAVASVGSATAYLSKTQFSIGSVSGSIDVGALSSTGNATVSIAGLSSATGVKSVKVTAENNGISKTYTCSKATDETWRSTLRLSDFAFEGGAYTLSATLTDNYGNVLPISHTSVDFGVATSSVSAEVDSPDGTLTLAASGGAAAYGWGVSFKVSESDGTTRWIAAKKNASGIWTATLPATSLSYGGATATAYVNVNDATFAIGSDYFSRSAPSSASMLKRIGGYASPTGYLLAIDTSGCRVGVYVGSKGHWEEIAFWPCSPGALNSPTVTGVFSIAEKGYSFDSYGARCFYYTQFCGDYLFHSTLYYADGTPMDSRLGLNLSHGCVRLSIENAKWIYDNIPRGTTVVSY